MFEKSLQKKKYFPFVLALADRRRDKLRHGLRQGNRHIRQVCSSTFTVAIQFIPAPTQNSEKFGTVEGFNVVKGFYLKIQQFTQLG